MIRQTVVFSVLVLSSWQAIAINKCVDPTGKVVFQDAPCMGKGEEVKVRPASGHASPSAFAAEGAPAQATAPKTGTQKLAETLKDERIRREKWIVMNDAKQKLDSTRSNCEAEQKQLVASKAWSNNNLAGATRDSSISQEMTAAATVCDSRLRAKEKEVEAAEKVCTEVKCIPAY